MSIWKGLLAPFSLLWKYSGLLAPARNLVDEGGHWTDYVCAVIFVFVAAGVLIFLAVNLSNEFVISMLVFAATLVAIKYACYYFFH